MTEKTQKMADSMYSAAEDCFGRFNMPASAVAYEFCSQAEYDEPGTYPEFRDVSVEEVRKALSLYVDRVVRRGSFAGNQFGLSARRGRFAGLMHILLRRIGLKP